MNDHGQPCFRLADALIHVLESVTSVAVMSLVAVCRHDGVKHGSALCLYTTLTAFPSSASNAFKVSVHGEVAEK